MRLSVVLPCFNVSSTLRRALDALVAQSAPDDTFEIIVVDDGSTDGTAEIARAWNGRAPCSVLQQPNRGLAAARNAGAARARGEVLLFLDPDVFARPDLVTAHLRHYAAPDDLLAVQGRTINDPATLVNAFMRTLERMPDLTRRRRDDLSPLHVVGRNFSVSRRAFDRAQGFDEGFKGYGLEDVDFGLRLRRAGGRIRYEPLALGVHHHVMTVEAAMARQQSNGRAAVHFWRKYGRPLWLGLYFEIHPVLLPMKWLMFRTGLITTIINRVRPWAEQGERHLILNECYNHLIWKGYYQGVFTTLRENRPRAAPR